MYKSNIQHIAVIGAGVIGAGWIARMVENGLNVTVFDPTEGIESKIEAVLSNSRHATERMITAPRPNRGRVSIKQSLAEAVSESQLIIESVPERVDIKQSCYEQIETHAASDALIASSTSGIMPSLLQQNMQYPQRLIVAHPFNPVYLLPLVEVVGGEKTSQANLDKATAFYHSIGMHPLFIKKEIDAFIADRLLEAVWRESLWLVKDGIASTQDIDDAIRYGFGLRWAQMGVFETYRIAGGEAGMRHFMEQFGPCLSWPWTKLMDVPEFNSELVDLIVNQSDEQSGNYSIRELERIRDNNLVDILQALKMNQWGAGKTLNDYEAHLREQQVLKLPEVEVEEIPVKTFECFVPAGWADYNGHMTESRYLECFTYATDQFMAMIGADQTYVESGHSYFTVETHIQHLDEVSCGDNIFVTTQVLGGQGKKMHLFHRLFNSAGDLLCTGEHMLIHVSLNSRQSSLPDKIIQARLNQWVISHQSLDRPSGAGRAIA